MSSSEQDKQNSKSENEVLKLKNDRLECLLKVNDLESDIAKLEKEDQSKLQNQNKVLVAKNERFELLLKAKQLEIEIKNYALKRATKTAASVIKEQERENSGPAGDSKSRGILPPPPAPYNKPKPAKKKGNQLPPVDRFTMFVSFETKLVSGFAKFIENGRRVSSTTSSTSNSRSNSDDDGENNVNMTNESGEEAIMDLYESYQEWYDDLLHMTHALNSNMVLNFPGHLFVKWKLSPKKGIILSSQEVDGDSQSYIEVGTLPLGWTHANTRAVVVLHPTQRHKTVELYPMGSSSEWHIWKNIEKVSEYQNGDGYVICCCRKR